jgi:hypothetical protein
LVSGGGSGKSKEHGNASKTKKFRSNNRDDREGSNFIRLVVHRALYRLAHNAAESKGREFRQKRLTLVQKASTDWRDAANIFGDAMRDEFLGPMAAERRLLLQ